MPANPTNLTPKQEAFSVAMLTAASASDAYRSVYSASRMTPKQVHEEASKLLASPKVSQRVAELRAKAAEKAVLTEARVLEEIARIGLFDPRKLFNADGSPKSISELDDATAAAIQGVEVVTIGGEDGVSMVKKYKIADKNSALEKLMKHMGMFEKDNKQRAGMFDNVPADTLRMIEEKLRGLTAPGMAGQPDAGSSSRTTH